MKINNNTINTIGWGLVSIVTQGVMHRRKPPAGRCLYRLGLFLKNDNYYCI